jgi:hypothetical protein
LDFGDRVPVRHSIPRLLDPLIPSHVSRPTSLRSDWGRNVEHLRPDVLKHRLRQTPGHPLGDEDLRLTRQRIARHLVSPKDRPGTHDRTSAFNSAVTPVVTAPVTAALSPAVTSAVTAALSPRVTLAVTPAVSRAVTPAISPAFSLALTAELTPPLSPAVYPNVNPELSPALTAGVTARITTGVTPGVTPPFPARAPQN